MRVSLTFVAATFAAFAAQGYEIKLPDVAKPWEKTAAQELGAYMKRLASDGNVTLGGAGEVTFHVGDTPFAREKGLGAATFADEEWCVKSFGRDVVLAGGGTRGTLYAVYHFLEDECGVRWWHDDDEDVPEARSLALPVLDRRGKPYFLQRDIWRTSTNDVRTLVRNRLNGNGGHAIPLAWGGGVTYGPPHLCHTWDRYLPFKTYGKEHPEWYSLRDGKRVGGQHHGQLCLSCPGLAEVLAAKVKESIAGAEAKAKAAGEPAPRFYDLTMNDNKFFCTCDACKAEVAKYGHSGQQIRFANRVAAIAGEGRPDLLFTVSSYLYSSDLPSNGVHTASNVVLRTGPTRNSMGASVLHPDNAYFTKQLRGWKSFADTLFIWDYSITYCKPTEGMPFPSEYHYGDKYRLYADCGVKGLFWEHETPAAQDMYELKFFIERKLLEDPGLDDKVLLDDFYRRYYRAAAPHVRAARDYLRKIYDGKKAFVTWFPRFGEFSYIDTDDIRVMEGHFQEAMRAAAGDSKLVRRVSAARGSLQRVVSTRAKLRKCAPEKGFAEGRPFYEFDADWFDLYDKANVTCVDDPLSPCGRAVRVNADSGKYDLPFVVACNWSQSSRRHLERKYDTLKTGDGYSWYRLDVSDVPTNGYFFATSAWSVQCPLGFPEVSGRRCDVYFSARFTGPKFRTGSREPNRIFVDRIRIVPVSPADQPAIVSFRDAAKIKTWDAWNDHKGPQKWKERPCVTWRKLNAVDPGLKRIGTLKTRTAKEIRSSRWSVGCETLDRDYADWDQYKRFLGDLGAKRGRLFSGWAKTEQEKGVYDFSWLDPQVREMTAMGVKPWICISYGNPVWGSDFRLGMRVRQVTDNPEAFAAWLRYVKALVARYKDVVDEWEIWNEPFGQQEEYAKMVYETARIVKSEQPEAKCIVTALKFGYTRDTTKNEYRAVAEKLKAENALDLVKYWVFHPYCANPDWAYLTYDESEAICESNEMTYEWRRYFAPEIEKFLKGYSKEWTVIQGEVGCPSQLEFAHALNGIEWTEYSQAKWNLRLQMGAAVREIPSNLFTFIDLQYTFMLQSFGLIRSNTLKEPVYRRPSYYAMRNFYSVFDDDVLARGFERRRVGGKELSVAKFTRMGKPFAAVWFSGERPGDSLAYEAVDLSLLAKDRPMEWIDLLTGRAYELREVGKTPVWDSPVLLAGDGVIPLE